MRVCEIDLRKKKSLVLGYVSSLKAFQSAFDNFFWSPSRSPKSPCNCKPFHTIDRRIPFLSREVAAPPWGIKLVVSQPSELKSNLKRSALLPILRLMAQSFQKSDSTVYILQHSSNSFRVTSA